MTKPLRQKDIDIGVRIGIIRHAEKMSQWSFASALDVDRVVVGYWETGQRKPSYRTIKRICDRFNVSADWLMGYSEEMYRKG